MGSAQGLSVSRSGDALTIRAPRVGFLTGEALARLKDGRSVPVELSAMALAAPASAPVATARQVFVLSYDLWEERFAVARSGSRSTAISHLTPAAAESWCVEQLAIPIASLGANGGGRFWIRLEYRILDGDGAADPDEGSGFTLQGLIDVLSRRRKTEPSAHAIEGGPFSVPPRGSGPSPPR